MVERDHASGAPLGPAESKARPIPVRATMGNVAPEHAGRDTERTVVIAGEPWIARVIGSTRSGSGSDRGTPLVLIAFAKADEPHLLLREGYAVGESSSDLGEHELEELHARAKPYRTPEEHVRTSKQDPRTRSGPPRRERG